MPHPGELWLAAIPFTTGVAAKIQPVLILWEDAADVVVATVTSVSPRSASDVSLRRRFGELASEDAQRVKEAWAVSSQLRF
jgi:mRNA-degrading endonuclease toxin of MazEF toxin-antitoxin module